LAPNDLPYLDFRLAEICPCQQIKEGVHDVDDASRVHKRRLLSAAP
jgi:hypothetical protein